MTPRPPARSVGLIVKATRSCNLRCTYCNDWRPGSANTMSFEVLLHLVHRALSDPVHQSVRFTWHGGEPTMLPRRFYERAMALQDRFRRPGQHVSNSIMTNATQMTDDWARFLERNRFTVGVSLDGPPEIHDRYRVNVAGRPTFSAVMRGIGVLRAHGVDFGVTMVLDRAGYDLGPDRLFEFLVGEGVTSFGINFVMPGMGDSVEQARQHYITTGERAEFLRGMYARWKRHGDPTIAIREIDALRNRIAHRYGGPCTLSGSCWGALYSIEPTGEVCHCDYFLGDDDYVWGSVLTDSFDQIRRSAVMRTTSARHERARLPKQRCPEFEVCKGGCPHEHLMAQRLDPAHTADCCGLRAVIDDIRADAAPAGLPLRAVSRG